MMGHRGFLLMPSTFPLKYKEGSSAQDEWEAEGLGWPLWRRGERGDRPCGQGLGICLATVRVQPKSDSECCMVSDGQVQVETRSDWFPAK